MMNRAARDLVSIENKNSIITEQYRKLRTNIQLSKAKKELKSIVVTSAVQEEGKSTTVANLACMFAEIGEKVLLIDADLRFPTVHFTFHLNNLKGLTNILINQELDKSIIRKSEIDNLYILTAGPLPPNPAKLLTGNFFSEMLEELYSEFDLILLDSPPVLAIADTQLILENVSASLLVLNIEKTDKKVVERANNILKNSTATYLGIVINNMNSKMTDFSYIDYYSKYYVKD